MICRVWCHRMGFVRVIRSRRVCLRYQMICFHPVLTSCGVGTENTPPHGQGILIHWALDLILKEVDKEADKLAKPKSSFHCPSNWSWDSLRKFSLHSQHNLTTQKSPVIWSVLTTIAVSKDQRAVTLREEADKRDPWQVSQQQYALHTVTTLVGRSRSPVNPDLLQES